MKAALRVEIILNDDGSMQAEGHADGGQLPCEQALAMVAAAMRQISDIVMSILGMEPPIAVDTDAISPSQTDD